jgi:hypothetical protein
MQTHGEMWKRSGIPTHTLVDHPPVYEPSDTAGSPFYSVEVKVQGGVEVEVNSAWRAPIPIGNRCAVIAGIEEDVN